MYLINKDNYDISTAIFHNITIVVSTPDKHYKASNCKSNVLTTKVIKKCYPVEKAWKLNKELKIALLNVHSI